MPETEALDLVFNHDLGELHAWLTEIADEGLPWRLTAIDDADDPAVLLDLIRQALRLDPDGLVLRISRPFSPELPRMVAQAVLTGHVVLVRGASSVLAAALEGAVAELSVRAESGYEVLSRLPGRSLDVELSYVSLDQAPRPDDLEAGFDRYETTTVGYPAGAASPAEPGEAVPLKVETPNRFAWEPEGTLAVSPFPDATPIVRGALPAAAQALINATTARVYAVARYDSEDETGPPLTYFRIYLDVPAWIGSLVPQDGAAYRQLTAEGRRPVITFKP